MQHLGMYVRIPPMVGSDPDGRNAGGDYVRYAGLGFTFVFLIGVFVVGGYGLDRLFETLPLFLLLGIVAGFAAALAFLYVRLFRSGDG
jgi:ATP synthase protein I